ncbi:MAG: hypothetical protein G3I10_05910, partial [Ferrovum sp.]|nr:hypothetical protein [Ferrovum sp.]
LPVGATARQAYAFAIRGFLRNLAIVWLSEVLFAALVVVSLPLLLGALAHGLRGVSSAHPNLLVLAAGGTVFMRYAMLIAVAGLFFRAQMMTGLTQRALGQRTGYAGVYLSFGASFWRVFGAYVVIFLLLTAVQIAATLLLVLPAVALVAVGHGTAGTGASPDLGIAMVTFFVLWRIALFVVVTYLFIRLSFVVTAVIVAEQRFDLIRPWRLVEGNVLRIFALGLALFVPFVLVFIIVYVLVLGGEIWTLAHTLAQAQAHGRQFAADLLTQTARAIHGLLVRRWFLLLPLGLITATLGYGLAAGAGVSGYQSLVSGADKADAARLSAVS